MVGSEGYLFSENATGGLQQAFYGADLPLFTCPSTALAERGI